MEPTGTGEVLPLSRTGRAAIAAAGAVERAITMAGRLLILVSGIALTVIMTTNVLTRYLMPSGGFAALQELPERLFPWFIAGGIVVAAQAGGHMAVDWLLEFVGNERRRRWLLHLGNAIIVISYAVLFQQAMLVADITKIERSPVLGLPGSHGYWAIAACCIALCVVHITSSVRIALLGTSRRFSLDYREA
ncbi:MAG: TRAP transporter small permease subunit [Methylobacterium sp.]|nr:TRAP transporter small permease subunit [Methylobacterium sp.]MCA3654062.1 TRAP transporter small permease subunit [Methylobacterium sp.]MCA3657174.1 TRAP transporter small permease subunit [Methylobacterium sp.]MCA3661462.1 TRAP transporter small permease subunit [Methylobacterium sp.]MCA3664146.1 TRAP transporter small permease subunit [Methylobacterium sp.]